MQVLAEVLVRPKQDDREWEVRYDDDLLNDHPP